MCSSLLLLKYEMAKYVYIYAFMKLYYMVLIFLQYFFFKFFYFFP